jgi:hypothetical protein
MTIHGPSFRRVLLSTAVFCLLFFSASRSLGGDEARPIASLTPEQRSTGLPDSTMVKFTSGRTAMLGVLRAEHRARLERFTKAAELGKTVAAKLAAQRAPMEGTAAKVPPSSPPKQSAAVNPSAVSQPGTFARTSEKVEAQSEPIERLKPQSALPETAKMPAQSGGARAVSPPPPPKLSGVARSTAETATPPSLVPLIRPPYPLKVPRDWQEFCNAASASACIYLPASTTFTGSHTEGNWVFAYDEDPLINDESVCEYDGGSFGYPYAGTCTFMYPQSSLGDFKPTGSLSTKAYCDPPGTYTVDPNGAVKVLVFYFDQSFTTGSTPQTCVVQVWMYQ